VKEIKENNIQKIVRNEVTTKEQLDELYKCSALTFEGVWTDNKSIKWIIDWIKKYSEVSNPLPIHIITGQVMNKEYHLTGKNKYPNEYTILSIKLNDIKNVPSIALKRFDVRGRWFDDIVDNNKRREEEKTKPKCALIGQDGNIYNLMGIASRTLKENKMQEEAKEMIERVTSSHSYDEALCIIGEYVEITGESENEEEEEFFE